MMLTQLATVARRTGYPVIEVRGWKTRGRPGGMLGVRTITCHHTASGGAKGNYPSLRVVRDGRSGLPGPLAQYGLGRDGTIFVIAAGRCNHAGVSRSRDYTNSYAIGIEAEAVGVPGAKGDWPARQMESYQRLCRALVDEFSAVQVADVRGHKETCSPRGRKSDPSFSMSSFRSKVAAVDLRKPPTRIPSKDKDDDPMTPADFARIEKMLDVHQRDTVAAVRREVIKLITTTPLVPNKPSEAQLAADPNAKTSLAPIAWFLSNIEIDQDNDRDRYLSLIAEALNGNTEAQNGNTEAATAG
jgi:N-acetyl-anhydromuramyl-L-alanine amidase AmpD